MESKMNATEGKSGLNVPLLERSFKEIAPVAEEFVAAFYERLFAMSPEVKLLFDGVDMVGQRKKLISGLVLVMENLRKPQVLESALTELGKRHQGYKVVAEHYPLVGEALLRTFASFLGDGWTRELEGAWSDAYGAIVKMMLKGYRSIHAA